MQRELDILRIVQEALTNAIRHGRAAEAWVSLDWEAETGAVGSLRVQVRDNGQGFDVDHQSGSGWGLKNMQRRAEQLGAGLRIQSQPGAATVVDPAVPLLVEATPEPDSS